MLAFAAFALLTGAVLAAAVSVRQFAVGVLFILVAGFAQEVRIGVPVGHAMVSAMALFVCAQFGYVIGIAVTALVSVKSPRSSALQNTGGVPSDERKEPKESEPIPR